MFRRTALRLLILTLIGSAGLAVTTPANAALPAYSTAPKTAPTTSAAQKVITQIAVGHHVGFDRVVWTFAGTAQPGYNIRYVPRVFHDGSGAPVTLEGKAFLWVIIKPTSTAHPAPQQTITPRFPAIRQIKGAGDLEAVTSYGVGVSRKLGFRVFRLSAPSRLVLDVRTG
jgi:hypothetical protein